MIQPLFDLVQKFNRDIAPPKGEALDVSLIVQGISEWIALHQDALLLAWFAQYGFEPGKAVIVNQHAEDGWKIFIREATAAEREQMRQTRENA